MKGIPNSNKNWEIISMDKMNKLIDSGKIIDYIKKGKKMAKKIVLKKDFIIPKGTEFECIDGNKREWIEGNYEASFAITNDTTGYFLVYDDCLEDDRFGIEN